MCSNVFKHVQTCSKLVQMCSNVFKLVQNSLKCVQMCSNLFTTCSNVFKLVQNPFKCVQTCSSKKTRSYMLWHEIGDTISPQEINQSLKHESMIWKCCQDHILSKDININVNLIIKYWLISSTVRVTKAVFLSFTCQSPVCCHLDIQKNKRVNLFWQHYTPSVGGKWVSERQELRCWQHLV